LVHIIRKHSQVASWTGRSREMSESVSSEDRLSRLCRISFSMASLFGSALRVVTRCFERWSATEQKPRSCQREVLSNHNGICTLLLRFYFIRFNNKTRHKQKPADHKTEWHEFDRNSGMMFNDTDIWMWGLFLLYFSTRFGQKVSLHGTRCSLTRTSECEVYFYCTFRQGSVRKSVYMARGVHWHGHLNVGSIFIVRFHEGRSESQSTWHAVFIDTGIWMWGLFLLYFSTMVRQKVSLHGTRCSLTRTSECEVYFYCTFRRESVRKSVYMARGVHWHGHLNVGSIFIVLLTRVGQKVSPHGTRCSLTRTTECEVYFYCTFRRGSVRKSVYMARGVHWHGHLNVGSIFIVLLKRVRQKVSLHGTRFLEHTKDRRIRP